LRSNGYSLARRALLEVAGRALDEPAWTGAGDWSLADELLRPSEIYAPAVLDLIEAVDVHGLAHITGGGVPGNVARILGEGVGAVFDHTTWRVPPIFGEIQRAGDVDDAEMARVFNLGLGLVAAVDPADIDAALAVLAAAGREASVVGRLVAGAGEVQIR
jgi:phosphoribosylformylglycinamidine cyclo-ligase